MPRASVSTQEIDVSYSLTSPGEKAAAVVAFSPRGPITPTKFTDSRTFLDRCGSPEPTNSLVPGAYGHYTVLAILRQGPVWFYRATKSALYGGVLLAGDDGTDPEVNIPVPAGVSALGSYTAPAGYCLAIFGENPGAWNNDLAVEVEQDPDDSLAFWIRVYEKLSDGTWDLKETWSVSRSKTKIDGYGKSQYVVDVINDHSAYIRVVDSTTVVEAVRPVEEATELAFEQGNDGVAPTSTEYSACWEVFKDKNKYPVRYLAAAGVTDAAVITELDDVVGTRKDCIAYIDPEEDDSTSAVANTIAWRNGLSILNTERMPISGFPWLVLADEYTDKEVVVPPSGYVVAGAMYTHNEFGIEYAPMGTTRMILPVNDLDVSITDSDEDDLLDNQVNPIVHKVNVGIVRMGELNLKLPASAMSHEQARYLLDDIEQPVLRFLERFIGELNTEFNRLQVEAGIKAYLEPYKAREALYDYEVVCDTTNNTSQTIDANELHVDVAVKIARPVYWVKLKIVVTRTDANFSELFGRV